MDYLIQEQLNSFEPVILILLSTASMLSIVSSYDLISNVSCHRITKFLFVCHAQAEDWESGRVVKRSLDDAFKTDEDGVLTLEEFTMAIHNGNPAIEDEKCASMFEMLDVDNNGTLSQKEVSTEPMTPSNIIATNIGFRVGFRVSIRVNPKP